MRAINLFPGVLLVMVLILSFQSTGQKDEGVSYDEFTLNIGDRVDISDYRIELVEIQSIRDGLTVVRVSRGSGEFDEQRVMLFESANKFEGGSESGGLTITVTNIFDEESAKLRIEYPSSMGTPRKRTIDRSQVVRVAPVLSVDKTFDKSSINVGDEVRVSVTVKNLGTDTARDIQVMDQVLPEFTYPVGYPPKFKAELQPGESDNAVYIMNAAKEGLVKVPAIEVRYSDFKDNIKTNSSQGFEVTVAPPRRANLEIRIDSLQPLQLGSLRTVNVTLVNTGQAPATRVEVTHTTRPDEGLWIEGMDRTYFEIPVGGIENYSASLRGDQSGNYSVDLELSYLEGSSLAMKKANVAVTVKGREYGYLYYLLLVPLLLVAYRVYKRYKEYKY